MKKFTFLLVLFMGIAGWGFGQQVLISRNCDPLNNYTPDRFAEIYNAGATSVDLTGWKLENVQGGAVKFSWTLSGTIDPGKTKICGNADATGQTFTPDFTATWVGTSWNGTGGDGTVLKDSSGTVIDSAVQHSTAIFSNKEMKRKLTVTSPSSTYQEDQWIFSNVTNANDVAPGFHGTVWRISSYTIWSTASNWDCDVPGPEVDAYIPGGVAPEVRDAVSAPAQCKNLTIASGGTLIITVGNALTINDNLSIDASTSPGTLTIASDATGNGSLIVNGTVTGSATVQRYIAAYSAADNGWHEIGCPVSSYSTGGTDWDPTGTTSDLYYWDEATNYWKNYKTASFDFSAGQGYLVANDDTLTHVFTGTLNNSNIAFSNLSYNTTKGNGWHLLGNPFPSALTWGDANWLLNNVVATAKVWNESTGNYIDDTSGQVIPSTNGFFVQVTSDTNSLTIPAADRVHDATNNYKEASATNNKEKLMFKVTNDANSLSDESIIGFKSAATEGFDNAFDSHKLFSMVKTAPSLWTVSKDQQFSTNYLPEMTKAYNVPLDFKPGVSTVYHLSVTGFNSFDNPNFVLEDTKTGKMIDLSNQTTYDFSATKGDDVSRFVLHINSVTAVPSLNQKEAIQVFSYGKTIYLNGNESLSGKVSVFNTLGQQVYEGALNGMNKQTIRLNQKTGIYFVRVENASRVITRKVFIQ